MIGALDIPTSGKDFINEKNNFAMKEKALTIFRRRNIGFIFQAFNLIPELSVEQNMIFPLPKETARQYEQTVIMITHNPSIAHTADRVFRVSDGVLTDLGGCRA